MSDQLEQVKAERDAALDDRDIWRIRWRQLMTDYEEAETERARLAATLDRVRELHTPSNGHNPNCHCGIPPHADRDCKHCRRGWPCPTVAAIEGTDS